MELRHYIRMLGRGWWIIALAALSGLLLALARSYVTEPQYRTSTRLLLSPDLAQIQSGQELYAVTTLQNRSTVATISEIMKSGTEFKAIGQTLNLPPGEIFHYKNSAVTIPEASVLELFVDGPDPEITALLANNMAGRAIDYVNQTYPVYRLTVLDAALAPSVALTPKPLRDGMLSLILGGVLGAVLAVIQEQLRTPLHALRRRNITDSVSTAFTRRHFDQQARETLARVQTASLGLIYLDGLVDLTETTSAPIIQRVLRQVHTILRNELRGNDSIGRWDASTFAILLPDTSESAATRTLNRILVALSAPLDAGADREAIRLIPYAGGATRTEEMLYPQLTEEAQHALDRSYRSGENKVLFAAVQPQSA